MSKNNLNRESCLIELEPLVEELKGTPEKINDAVTLITTVDRSWASKLDKIVSILLDITTIAFDDKGFEANPIYSLDSIIDFTSTRELVIVFSRFEQTRRIYAAYSAMAPSNPDFSKYKAELTLRGFL